MEVLKSIWLMFKKILDEWQDQRKLPEKPTTTLKSELNQLILSETEKLKTGDLDNKKFDEEQRNHFAPMWASLQNTFGSLDSEYIECKIYNKGASIHVGRKDKKGHFEDDQSWKIEPNYRFRHQNEAGESLFIALPGIRVEETIFTRYPEFDYDEKILEFNSISEVIQHMMKPIAKQIAFYKHLKENYPTPPKKSPE